MPTVKQDVLTKEELSQHRVIVDYLMNKLRSALHLSEPQMAKLKEAAFSALKAAAEKGKTKRRELPKAPKADDATPPKQGTGNVSLTGWEEDKNGLVKFLEDSRTMAKYLVEHRVSRADRQMFVDCFLDVDKSVDDAIAKLNTIDSDKHPSYQNLAKAGLTLHNLKLKLRELGDSFHSSSFFSALRIARRILGSLLEEMSGIELFKEFLETVEERLKRGPDDELTQLHIFDFKTQKAA